MLALGLALEVGALLALGPWGSHSLTPSLQLGPGIGISIAIDDSEVVASDQGLRVANARIVGGRSTLADAHDGASAHGSTPAIGVSPGQAVAPSLPVSSAPPPPQAESPSEPVPAAPQPSPGPSAPPSQEPAPSFAASPEKGLRGWRGTAAGNVAPTVALASIQIREGDEYALAFSFFIEEMVYGQPGADNLIMRLKSDGSESHNFGLQLWDYAGDDGQSGGRGLWSSGEAMGGARFLAPVSEQAWHDVVIHFEASSWGAGFYEIYLDGALIDARDDVSVIVPGSDYAQIEVGLLRDGERILGTSELRLDAVRLGDTLESVLP